MNRKERRANLKRGRNLAPVAQGGDQHPGHLNAAELAAVARNFYKQGQLAQAENICRKLLASDPANVNSLNLLGLIAQAAGRHNAAVKFFAKAIAADSLNAACHYNIASSFQALSRWDDAVAHFDKTIALGMSGKDIEAFLKQSPIVADCLQRIARRWPLPMKTAEVLGEGGIAAVANDAFFRCAMESTMLQDAAIEAFLTHARLALLEMAFDSAPDFQTPDHRLLGFFSALAQQCFINEYVYSHGEQEIERAKQLRVALQDKLAAGAEISPLLLVAVAAYFPLHGLAAATDLVNRIWPDEVAGLLRRQVREPLEEAQDRPAIPALTAVDNDISLQVMQQYEENPFPRWTHNPLAVMAAEMKMRGGSAASGATRPIEILVAGCGTGQHSLQTATLNPAARILAVDISLPSLAHARRKTREADVSNVEYAQADILKLGSTERSFDRIEVIGVLHHLADPAAGWRVLLSLLRPNGEMYIGLYSKTARRAIADARALIAERGYRPTADDIRRCRQDILRDRDDWRWKQLIAAKDFYSISGCRDLLFNIMEHQFTIPGIKAFLGDNNLEFLGFDLDRSVIDLFQTQYPGAALTDLDQWQLFEANNPQTFASMYLFLVRKRS